MRQRFASQSIALAGTLALVCCCSDPAPAGTPASQDIAAEDSGPVCPPVRLSADGTCCPLGTWLDVSSGACEVVGPAGCASKIISEPGACTPRWCWNWRSADGGACDPALAPDCAPAGRLCTDDEIAAEAGCLAGWWPSPMDGGACVPAGFEAGATLPPVGPTGWRDGSPMDLPPIKSPRWCWQPRDAAGDPCSLLQTNCDLAAHVCSAAEVAAGKGCPAGEAPPLGSPDKCLPAGVPWDCPPGFVVDGATQVAAGGMASCKPDPTDCGEGPWPAATPGKTTLHVDSGAKAGGDGSAAKPLNSMLQALTVATKGTEILVAAGLYPQPLKISKALRIRGRCASMVHLSSNVGTAALQAYPVASGGTIHVSGLTIDSAGFEAVVVNPGGRLNLDRVHIARARNAGVVVAGAKARAQLTRSVVADVLPATGAPSQWSGSGIILLQDAEAALVDVRVHRCRGAGIALLKGGARLTGQRVAADETRSVKATGSCPGGLVVTAGAEARLLDLRLSHNGDRGLHVFGKGARLLAAGVLVESTVETPGLDLVVQIHGRGVDIYEKAEVELYGARLMANAYAGLGVTYPDTRATLVGLVSHGNLPTLAGDHGVGIVVGGFASALVMASVVRENHSHGLVAIGEDANLVARSVIVTGTKPRPFDGGLGRGVDIADGGRLVWLGGRLSANLTAGASVRGAKSKATFAGVLADGQLPVSDGPGVASGLVAAEGAQVTVVGGRTSGNGSSGVCSFDGGTSLLASGLLTASNRPKGDWKYLGAGAWVTFGGDLRLDASVAAGNHMAGVLVQTASARLRHSVVRDTRVGVQVDIVGGKTELADGVAARDASLVEVERSVFHDQPRAGLLMDGGLGIKLLRNVSAGNQYGLVLERKPTVTEQLNLYHDNAENRALGGGLAVVPPPSVVTLGESTKDGR